MLHFGSDESPKIQTNEDDRLNKLGRAILIIIVI